MEEIRSSVISSTSGFTSLPRTLLHPVGLRAEPVTRLQVRDVAVREHTGVDGLKGR